MSWTKICDDDQLCVVSGGKDLLNRNILLLFKIQFLFETNDTLGELYYAWDYQNLRLYAYRREGYRYLDRRKNVAHFWNQLK